MLIAFLKLRNNFICSMTDSMNFGPDWIRNLSSEGSTGGGTGGIGRYQLADYRYGREEMLALFDRNIKPPACLANFKSLYSEITLPPLALLPTSEEERVGWQGRPSSLGGPPRGRGTSLDRGGRVSRGRGGYQSYGRPPYEGGWGNGESSDWSPRKEYNARPSSMDNWRRARNAEEDDGWRMTSLGRGGMHEKWGRQSSWRGDGEDERIGGPERGGRWNDPNRNPSSRKSWDNEDHLPEWANENPGESGGSFDDRGAFHGSDDEQSDLGKSGQKKEGLQKSTSQQHISHKTHPPLLTSKSTMSLVKDIDYESIREDKHSPNNPEFASRDGQHLSRERKLSVPEAGHTSSKETVNSADRAKSEGPPKTNDVQVQETIPKIQDKVEVNDFERLQEDFVSKLVVDEEPPKQDTQVQGTFELPNLAPPLNLAVPGQDKWFYLDPQGQIQGPFTNAEMTEWFKAGYFGHDLKVRRQCDERFYLLGELMAMCNGNPFESSMRFPVLKNDISKIPEQDRQYPFVAQMQAFKQAQARVLADPWSTIAVQQQELAAQRLIIQQQQVPPDLPYVQEHPPPANPLMHMINQMQQANKLPPTGFIDKQPPNLTGRALDPHLHMSHYLSLQNRLPGALANHQIPPALSSGMPGPPEVLAASLPGAGLGAGLPLQSGINSGLGLTGPPGQPVEANPSRESDPITKLLKQLHQGKQQPSLVESFWQPNQFGSGAPTAPQQQWPSQNQSEAPMSMWDMQQPPTSSSPVQHRPKSNELPRESEENILSATKLKKTEKSKDSKQNDDEKEIKKKKKIDEEQQKKDAEEKRKQEQRKLEFERKAEIEKKKKEEERIKKELDKAKKEAEEKRLRELEEKRRLKEQRKLEEVKKKSDEDRRKLEDEMIRREKEQREREERQRMEEKRQEQISLAKAAPWSQANSTFGMSLAEIQKAEKERKAQEAALQAQKAQEKELQLQQQQLLEKSSGSQMGWAKKNMEPRKVKSLAEIQAEEQERLAKEAAEARLKKEKEARETVQIQTTNTIWSGQSLNWASASSAQSQWTAPTNNSGGFWDEPTQKPQSTKPSNVTKSSSMSTINRASKQPQKHSPEQQPQKPKAKKEEATSSKKNHNNNVDDEFTNWCYKSLSSIDTNVDVPTFVTFLRDIESAFEVREYCKMYLGENNATQQFTNNFLEKRRSFKPKNAHTDDMCSPAPAITPSMHNSTEFQEVKGKNKKSKKSKMLKVDSRILGFNVTSAPDRINVGDRDYGDNS